MQALEARTQTLPEVDLDAVPMVEEPEEDVDGLAEYSFPKFAATYFQKSASYTHIRRPLHYPLLYHEDDTDCSVPGSSLVQASPWFRGNTGQRDPCRPRAERWSSRALCLHPCRPPWWCGASF